MRTLRQVATHPDARVAVILVVVLNVVSAIVFSISAQPTPGVEPDPLTRFIVEQRGTALVLSLLFGPIVGLIGYAVWAALVTWLGRLFDGTGSFRSIFATLVFAAIPPTIVGLPLQLVPLGFGPLAALAMIPVGLAVAGWAIVLSVIAIREAHRISTGSAVGVAVILLLVILVLSVTVAIAIFVTWAGA